MWLLGCNIMILNRLIIWFLNFIHVAVLGDAVLILHIFILLWCILYSLSHLLCSIWIQFSAYLYWANSYSVCHSYTEHIKLSFVIVITNCSVCETVCRLSLFLCFGSPVWNALREKSFSFHQTVQTLSKDLLIVCSILTRRSSALETVPLLRYINWLIDT